MIQPTIKWTVGDREVETMELIFKSIATTDAGPYICTANNSVGSSQKVFYLTVTEIPKITTEFENITLKGGDTKFLSSKYWQS